MFFKRIYLVLPLMGMFLYACRYTLLHAGDPLLKTSTIVLNL